MPYALIFLTAGYGALTYIFSDLYATHLAFEYIFEAVGFFIIFVVALTKMILRVIKTCRGQDEVSRSKKD